MNPPINILNVILWLLGGLALFLYGIDLMGHSLRQAVGTKFRVGLDRFTKTPFRGLLTGTVVTGLIQSSSATTVMVVSFISAGLLTFQKSIGLILGANIGTTITPQIMALNLDAVAVPMIGIGFIINCIAKKRFIRNMGMAIMGFGLLFFGLMLMKYAVSEYQQDIQHWLEINLSGGIRGWILAFAIATISTAIIQVSAATVVFIQALAFQGAITDIGIAIPMILGAGVGTCITALLASLKSGNNPRRAAYAHLIFNLLGTVITICMLKFYLWFIPKTSINIAHQIANCHLAIKFINVMIFLPFADHYSALIIRLFPKEDLIDLAPRYLISQDLDNPQQALNNVRKEINRMCMICTDMIQDAIIAFFNRDERLREEIIKQEDLVDILYYSIADYARSAAKIHLSSNLSDYPANLFHIMNHVERLGDHAENIVELSQAYSAEETNFITEAQDEIKELAEVIDKMAKQVHNLLETPDTDIRKEVLQLRKVFKEKRTSILENQQKRVEQGKCLPLGDIVFIDILDNLLSIVRHLEHIAKGCTS